MHIKYVSSVYFIIFLHLYTLNKELYTLNKEYT